MLSVEMTLFFLEHRLFLLLAELIRAAARFGHRHRLREPGQTASCIRIRVFACWRVVISDLSLILL